MKAKKDMPIHPVVNTLRKIINDKGLAQYVAAEMIGTSASQFSKILSGEVQLSLWHISNFATCLNMSIIDIFTYPDVYVKKQNSLATEEASSYRKPSDEIKATLTIELKKDTRDKVLRLLCGDKYIDILNK